jgi:hypothetical protein
MIDGTLAQQAGRAFDWFANNRGRRAERSRGEFVGGAEDGDGGNARRAGNVHRAGIVGEKDAAGRGHIDELAERGATGKTAASGGAGHLVAQSRLGGGTEYGDGAARFARRRVQQSPRRFGKALGQPSLGAAVCRARTDADDREA